MPNPMKVALKRFQLLSPVQVVISKQCTILMEILRTGHKTSIKTDPGVTKYKELLNEEN